jgi:hypothetical protein
LPASAAREQQPGNLLAPGIEHLHVDIFAGVVVNSCA